MALCLSKALGRSPESWLAMQYNHDLWQAKRHVNLASVTRVRMTVSDTFDTLLCKGRRGRILGKYKSPFVKGGKTPAVLPPSSKTVAKRQCRFLTTKRNPDVERPGRGEPGGTGIDALPVRRAATSSQSKIPLTAGVRLAILWM